MAKTAKNILSLNHEEAINFFMKSEQYHVKDMGEKHYIIDQAYQKLSNQPNSSYNQLCLQNMTYTQDMKNGTSPYTLRLCQLVAGKAVAPLWNSD